MKSVLLLIVLSFSSIAFAEQVVLDKRLHFRFESCVGNMVFVEMNKVGDKFVKYSKVSRDRQNINLAVMTIKSENDARKKSTYEVGVYSTDAKNGWMYYGSDYGAGFISMTGVEAHGFLRVNGEMTAMDFSSCL